MGHLKADMSNSFPSEICEIVNFTWMNAQITTFLVKFWQCRMFYSSILNELSVFLLIFTQIQSHFTLLLAEGCKKSRWKFMMDFSIRRRTPHYGRKSWFLANLDIPDISSYQLGMGCQYIRVHNNKILVAKSPCAMLLRSHSGGHLKLVMLVLALSPSLGE